MLSRFKVFNENKNKNIDFLEALTLIFITLKLCKVIDWSWFFVLLPAFIPFTFFLIAGIVVRICTIIEQERNK